ncbi:MAG: zinc ABC transporter permease AztB [Acidimicrobiia bacterium]|nr:zinc ABC transporter permease AztB [Acidimicrobiia bacterium]MDH3470141.1 zinc ABC transporter permease AztB [Acidimicrobiia bacterium]
MDWLTDPFSYEFMQRALAAGVLAVIATSVIGTWVVLRGMSFMGDALAHGVVPGIAIAFLLDVSLVLGAAAAAIIMIGAISVIHRTTQLSEDTAIGLLFVGMLALGVIIISRSGSFAVDLVAILFGDVVGTTVTDVVVQAVAALIVVGGAIVFYRPLLALAFNEEKAEVLGLNPGLTHLVMMGLITVAVVTSFQTVGTLLVFGLLIAPPATASLIARRVPLMMVTAAAIGSVAVVAGLLISFHFDTAAGATISGLAVAFFFVTLATRQLWRRSDQAT